MYRTVPVLNNTKDTFGQKIIQEECQLYLWLLKYYVIKDLTWKSYFEEVEFEIFSSRS